jgi:hypothetical protein
LLLAAGAALNSLGHGAVDVVGGDPALIVVLVGTRCSASRLGSRERLNLDLLDLLGGRFRAGLGEQGLNPGLVDEVQCSAKQTGQEEVEEDAKKEDGVSNYAMATAGRNSAHI